MYYLTIVIILGFNLAQQQYCTNFLPDSQEILQNIIPRNSAFVNNCKKHSNYEQYSDKILKQLKSTNRYSVLDMIGDGGSSDVFIGYDQLKKKKVILKKLLKKQQQEIQYNLKSVFYEEILADCEYIEKPLDIYRDKMDGKIILVYKYYETKKFKLNKIILYKILQVLNYAHSNGIMHRDIKPANIVIHHDQSIRLIDWNMATLYFFSKQNQVKLGTLSYYSPQMLFDYPFYHYSIDIWGVGAIMMEYYFGNILQGFSTSEMLIKYIKFFGVSSILTYIDKYKIKLDEEMFKIISNNQKTIGTQISKLKKLKNINEQGIDLMMKMLTLDHNKRILANEALGHPYFKKLNKQIKEKERQKEEKEKQKIEEKEKEQVNISKKKQKVEVKEKQQANISKKKPKQIKEKDQMNISKKKPKEKKVIITVKKTVKETNEKKKSSKNEKQKSSKNEKKKQSSYTYQQL